MLHIRNIPNLPRVFAINVGPCDNGVTVKFIAEAIVRQISPGAKITYGDQPRGWIGDVPTFQYDISRLISTGWSPSHSSAHAIILAIDEIAEQEGFRLERVPNDS